MSQQRAALVHSIMVYIWCALVIPTVFLWESKTWLIFMAFAALALVLVNNFQILNLVRDMVTEEKGPHPRDKKKEVQ